MKSIRKPRQSIFGKRPRVASSVLAIALIPLILATSPAQAQTFKVLYSFKGGTDAANPAASLLRDKAGNLYGTTPGGGTYSSGTVFKLARHGVETVLYSFPASNGIGASGLIQDPAGNLYGTTEFEGANGYGMVFQLTPNSDGTWTETALHSFDWSDGSEPLGSLVRDAAGNLYGTTQEGGVNLCVGNSSCGVIFKLTPNTD